jgi:N-methylhydantoinase A
VKALGVSAAVLTTKSNGGIMTAAEAGVRPVETLLSGPASGVIGAAFIAAAAGIDNIVTFDLGGTSADVAVIEGVPRTSTENHVGDFPVIMPAIDVTSIGAGGGSIAYVDSSGVLKVGPESAGADPGPVCYGLGGTRATVTDAYVSLGILDPTRFLGGRLVLNPELARAALAELGGGLGLGVVATAEAILDVATSQMYSALVPLLARKGIAYESFTLLAFGGGGPSHAFLLARDVGISRVLIPPHPGVLCAAGSLAADMRRDFVLSLHRTLGVSDGEEAMTEINVTFRALSAEGEAWLDAQAMHFIERRVEWSADLRYLGQSFEIAVSLTPADLTGETFRARFHAAYEQLYGYMDEAAPLEIRDLRVSAIGITPKPPLARIDPVQRPVVPPVRQRDIFLDGRTMVASVYNREDLPVGFQFAGPAIVEQFDTTVFITPEFTVCVDAFGNLLGVSRDVD